MKSFNRMTAAVLAVIAIVFAAANIYLNSINSISGRQYRVDASRASAFIEEHGTDGLELENYETLTAVTEIKTAEDLLGGNSDYLIKEINGQLYRFDYVSKPQQSGIIAYVNVFLAVMAMAAIAVLVYMRIKIISPFGKISEIPYALSKGNLAEPLQDNGTGLFGKFSWGMNMLRESIEKQKSREMVLQAEKKKLILSISHDIKIPLSAIKLYSKALEKEIYSRDKTKDIAVKINEKADEISGFVSKIVEASSEEFLALEVKNSEFYCHELLDSLRAYYSEKLRLHSIDFCIDSGNDCLLRGDEDRALEVIQNIVENAIKYGDGVSIRVFTSDEEDCRLIAVENTGCKLKKEELPHVFDSFWRGTNASDTEGSGLGLYICRTLMRKMGGDIFAEIIDGNMRITSVFPRA